MAKLPLAFTAGDKAQILVEVHNSVVKKDEKIDARTRKLAAGLVTDSKRLDELIEQTNYTDFSVVGTSTYTTSLASSLFILKKIKQQQPAIVTVMGGGVFEEPLPQFGVFSHESPETYGLLPQVSLDDHRLSQILLQKVHLLNRLETCSLQMPLSYTGKTLIERIELP